MSTKLKQFGIKSIYTDKKPNIDNILDIYQETVVEFNYNRALISKLIQYYKGDQYCGIPDTGQNVNEKIVVNYIKPFCDTIVSITLTKPLTYISRVDDEKYKRDVEKISQYMADEGDHETNIATNTDMVVDGVGYQYCLQQDMEQDPTPNSPFTIGRFNPKNTYVVRSFDIGNKVVCSFHIAEINDREYITAFDDKYKYVIIPTNLDNDYNVFEEDENSITNYIKGYKIIATAHDLPYNPITEFKNDVYGLSIVADLIGLQDSLNTAISNYDNDIIMKIKQILVVLGCELTEEQLKNLKKSGVLNLPPSNNSTDKIDAKFVSSQLNESIITYINDTIDRMCIISGCPSQNASGSAETGVAVQVQNGHTVANFMSNRREQSFYKPKREQLGNIITILRRSNLLESDIKESDIEIKFDKNRLTSMTENITNFINLINNYVDPLDALNVCPIFEDNNSVSQRIKANMEKELKENEVVNEQTIIQKDTVS